MLFPNTNYLFVYTSITKDEVVGHTTASLPALLALKFGKRNKLISQTFNRINYMNIYTNEASYISIQFVKRGEGLFLSFILIRMGAVELPYAYISRNAYSYLTLL